MLHGSCPKLLQTKINKRLIGHLLYVCDAVSVDFVIVFLLLLLLVK